MSTSLVTFPVIGCSSYQFNGIEGLRLHVVNDYDSDDKNSFGSFQANVNAPFSDVPLLKQHKYSYSKPASVTFEMSFKVSAGKTVMECKKVVSIVPFKENSVPVKENK
jgi:hypothetical protein